MGYDVNEFNEAMKNAETPTGKLQVALAYLTSSGLVETKKSFEQNNKQLIEAQSASNRLKEAWAGLGEKAGIVSTPIKNNLAAALEEVNALLGEITEKGFWKTFMEHGNDRPIQWDESSTLSPENWLTFEDVSNYLQGLFGTGDQTAIDEAMDGINQSVKEKGDSAVEDAKNHGSKPEHGHWQRHLHFAVCRHRLPVPPDGVGYDYRHPLLSQPPYGGADGEHERH